MVFFEPLRELIPGYAKLTKTPFKDFDAVLSEKRFTANGKRWHTPVANRIEPLPILLDLQVMSRRIAGDIALEGGQFQSRIFQRLCETLAIVPGPVSIGP